jgi:hypothetical protein
MVGGNHLLAAHGWTTAEYRDAFGLNVTASTVGPSTAERKRESMFEQISRGERSYPVGGGGSLPTAARWRSLAPRRPAAAAEWHPTRNRALEDLGVDPQTVGVKSAREVCWRCQACGHEWRSGIRTRCEGRGCPACYQRDLRQRSLAARQPDLLADWHPERNGDLDPLTIGHASMRKVWWRCRECGHEWRTTVRHRTHRGQGCPECAKQRLAEFAASCGRWRLPQERSIAALRPDLLAEWHTERNQGLDPFAIGPGSSLRVWWRCAACEHEWQTRPSHRCQGSGCPACSRRYVPPERSIAAMRPDLLADWHPDRNHDLDPFAIPVKTLRVRIWWRCRYCGHEWRTTPAARSQSKGGCRACVQRRAVTTQTLRRIAAYDQTMTATENIVDSIDNRLRQLKEEINTLTAARAALDGRDSPATKHRQEISTTASRPQNKGAGTRAAGRPSGKPAAKHSSDDSRPAPQKSRQPAKRARRQKRGTLEIVPADRLELLLSENGDMTTSALAERANGKHDQILTVLRELQAAGRIRRTGQRRSTRWHAIKGEERIQERATELAARSKTTR